MFDAKKTKEDCVQWIKDWFDMNGKDCNAVIGISGGKDSSVVAALCVEAIGKDRVIGVLMPDWHQSDIADAERVCEFLGIHSYMINIGGAVDYLLGELRHQMESGSSSVQSEINLPPRIRMATLYAVAQNVNGRVANTCNLSEDWVGYSTRYGDSVGDFSPLSKLTVTEVRAVGYELGLPQELIEKVPSDGLCDKTDEDNLGFTYEVLDKYIRTGKIDNVETKDKIDTMHEKNLFKLQLMPAFEYNGWLYDYNANVCSRHG